MDNKELAFKTALGKVKDVASYFGCMEAASEHMLQYLEGGISGTDWLQGHMLHNVWKLLACLAMGVRPRSSCSFGCLVTWRWLRSVQCLSLN